MSVHHIHITEDMRKLVKANAPLLALMKRCGESLGDMFSGKVTPREVIFPNGDSSAVEGVYQSTPQSRYYNDLAAEVLKSLIAALPMDREIRVLEIGAGTGSTTASLLPLLPAERSKYVFTDLSDLFLIRAKERFQEYDFVEYKTLNIGSDPSEQGFEPGSFDVIVAANVMHATPDLRESIKWLESLMAADGLLLLREITEERPVMGFEITFGNLLDKLSDEEFRHHHPFLSVQGWNELLHANGFERFAAYPDPADKAFDEHIIVARKQAGGAEEAFPQKNMVPAVVENVLHPLLGHRLASPLSMTMYESELSGSKQQYLAQHRVFELVVVPGTAHFEIAGAAGRDYFSSDGVMLENVVLREALMLPAEGSRTMQVLLTPSDSGADFQIYSSEKGDNANDWHLHVTGALRRLPLAESKQKVDLAALRAKCDSEVDVKSYYEKFDSYGAVQYGPAFRGLRRLWRYDGGSVAEVQLDRGCSSDGYTLHPALLDSCLQSMVAALAHNQKDLSGDGYMPFSVEQIAFYGKAPDTVWCHAQMKEGDSFNQEMFSANISVYTPEGELVAEVINLNMKRTNKHTLEMLKAGQQKTDVLYETVWRQIASPDEIADKSGSWLILADQETGTAEKVENALEEAGGMVSMVTYRSANMPAGMPSIDLTKPEAFKRTISTWLKSSTNPRGVIFLWALDSYESTFHSLADVRMFKALLGESFLHLSQVMAEHNEKKSSLIILTRGAQKIREQEIPVPTQGMMWGMEKSVANEVASVRPCIIDLDPVNEIEADMPKLLNIFYADGFKEDKLALRGGNVMVPRLVHAQFPAEQEKNTALARPAGEAYILDISQTGLSSLKLVPLERRAPEAGEIEIEVKAIGLNFKDVMVAMGLMPKVAASVGTDCSGIVTAVGEGVDGLKVGDKVFATAYGSFASHVVTAARSAAVMPEGLSFADAAAIPTVFMTACYSLLHEGRLQKGQKVLLHSAAGGVGLAAIQVAQAVGAEIYATAGSERKRALLRSLGVTKVYSSRSTKYAEQLMEDTDGEGVDVVLNFLTGELLEAGLKCLVPGGRFVEIGRTDLRTPEQIAAINPDIEYHIVDLEKMGNERPDDLTAVFKTVMQGVTDGTYTPIHKRVFTMEHCADAFRFMLEARHIGKVIVVNEFREATTPFRPEASYLISGGLSEIGLELAKRLVDEGARTLWLLARRDPKPDSPELSSLNELKKKAEIRFVRVDVTDEKAMRAVWKEQILPSDKPLAGVFHMPAVFDDDVIPGLNWKRFDAVLQPKVDGSWLLHELTADMDLDYFVMFSSVASVFGTHGQMNYVAANAFLDSLAAYRVANFMPALAVNWGSWKSVGAVARWGIGDRLKQHGVEGMDTAESLSILMRLMQGKSSQYAVVDMDWNKMLPILQVGSGSMMYSEMKTKTVTPVPGQATKDSKEHSGLKDKLCSLPMDERVEELKAYLRKEIASFLHISEDAIPDDSSLTSLGMDSLISLDLFQRIGKTLKIRIAPREMAAMPNVAAMAEKFAHDLGPDVSSSKKKDDKDDTESDDPEPALPEPNPIPQYAEDAEACSPFPLSDMQQAYWLGKNASGVAMSGIGCHFYLESDAEGLDIRKYEQSWNKLIARHAVLRTVIVDSDSQRVLPQVPRYTIKVNDLTQLSGDALEKELLTIREKLSHEVLAIDAWPNFRIETTRMPGNRVRTHFSFDLTMCDFHGISLLMRDLNSIYNGREDTLSKLDFTFREYRLAEEEYRKGERFADDREYWMERVDDLPAAPRLPLAVAPESVTKQHFTRKKRILSREIWSKLKERAVERGLNPTGITLAAFSEILGYWSDEKRFTLNLTLFNHLPIHPQVNEIVGEFTSNELLAVDLADGGTFEGRAGQIWAQLWEDMGHRSFSGVRVLRELARRRGLNSSIMPVVFTSTLGIDTSFDSFAGDGMGHEVFTLSQTPQVWLDHQLFEFQQELLLVWDYVDTLFPESMLDDMFDAYVALLTRLAEDDDAWHAKELVQLPARQAEVRRAVNSDRYSYEACAMFAPFLEQVRKQPDAVAVVCGDKVLSYRELEEESRRVALAVRSREQRAGQPVGVLMHKGLAQVIAVLGIQRAGCAYVPIDAGQGPDRIRAIVQKADISLVLEDESIPEELGFDGVEMLPLHKLPAEVAELPAITIDPEQLAYIIFTSGSTGTPKGVMISHRAAMNTIFDVNRRFAVGSEDAAFAISRLSFDLSVYDIFGLLAAGGRIVMPEDAESMQPSAWLELVRKNRVSIWNSVPALCQLLAEEAEGSGQQESLASLRLILLSGDWIPVQLPDRMKAFSGSMQVIGMGGATEASIWSNFHETGKLDDSWISIPYGKPLANQGFAVLDENFDNRPDWVPGDLYILGDGLSMGYLNDMEKTAAQFMVNPHTGERMYKTGDMARYHPDGNLEFLGRRDTQVKLHGYRIELGEIEAVLKEQPAIDDAVVLVHEGERGEQSLAAFVVENDAHPDALVRMESADSQMTEALADSYRKVEEYSDLDAEKFLSAWRDLSHLYLAAAGEALTKLGLFDAPWVDKASFLKRSGVSTRYAKWIGRALKALTKGGFIELADGSYKVRKAWPVLDDYLRQSLVKLNEMGFDSRIANLLEHTVHELHSILREDLHSGAIYTDESIPDLYQKVLAVCNHLAAKIAVRAVENAGDRAYRILEVGAGYGTVTRHILPHIKGRKVHYDFTDISQFFFVEARKEFSDYDFIDYKLFQLDEDPTVQGIPLRSYDMIIAGNVLHDVKNVRKTLKNLAGLLKPSGLILIMEQTEFQSPLELTEALQQGFESFVDVDLRPEHPMLSRESWQMVLGELGCKQTVFPIPPESLEHKLGIDIVLSAGPESVSVFDSGRLEQVLQSKLPEYMLPSRYQYINKMPLTGNGKIDRRRLNEILGQGTTENSEYVAPRNEQEKKIAEIWKSVLSLDRVSVEQSFFLCGGDSLSAFRLLKQFKEAFGKDYSLRDLLRAPTVAAQAELVSRAREEQGSLVVLNDVQSPVKLCFAHPIEGLVTSYTLLAEELPEIGFSALQSRGLEGEQEPVREFSVMVDNYLEALRPLLKSGTTVLGGWSMGSFLVWDMVSRLSPEEYSAPLVLIDPPSKKVWDEKYGRKRHDFLSLMEQILPDTPQVMQEIGLDKKIFDQLGLNDRIAVFTEALQRSGSLVAPADDVTETVRRIMAVGLANVEALWQCQPQKQHGRDILYVTSAGQHDDNVEYWRSLTDGHFELISVSGDHWSLMRNKKDMATVAERIRAMVQRLSASKRS